MSFITLDIPPGIVRPSTKYQAKGRWFDMTLVRWYDGVMQAWGGWSVLTNATSAAIGGPVRGMLAWRANNGDVRLIFGTNAKVFVYHSNGTLVDVTPAGNPAGLIDATGDEWSLVEANSWQFDNFGQDVVAVDQKTFTIFTQDASVAGGQMTSVIPQAGPAQARAIVVTPERFVVAIGTDDFRKIQWSDQGDYTSTDSWTPLANNQSGDFDLPGKGQLMAGKRGNRETLVWGEFELWAMRFIGGPFVYRFYPVGTNCGPISRRSMAMVDGRAIWMGHNSFFLYDGSVRPIPSPVSDFVFSSINRLQASKIAADVRSDFGEVIWYYPVGSGATENSKYVSWNYVHDFWMIGTFERTDGVDRGPLDNPLAADANGAIYVHEEPGSTHADEGGSPSFTPFIESGPFEIGQGDNTMTALQIIPDEDTLGEVNTTIFSAFYPTEAETTHGPFTLTAPTDIRLTGRQVRLKHTQVTLGWRIGIFRLNVTGGGLR